MDSMSRRYRRRSKAGRFTRSFEEISAEADMEYAMVDGTIVKVHRHDRGHKRGTRNQVIGKSKGGMTSKIPALADALGNPAGFCLLPGQRHDICGVGSLLKRQGMWSTAGIWLRALSPRNNVNRP